MVARKRSAPGLIAAKRVAKQNQIEQRARLIGAGVVFKKRREKFQSIWTTYNGESYQSLGEAEYANRLDVLLKAGKIIAWERPKPMVVFTAIKAQGRITYKPDFLISISQTYSYYVDYKGSRVNKKTGKRSTPTETDAWRLRVKLWKAMYPTLELRVVYSDGVEKLIASGATA